MRPKTHHIEHPSWLRLSVGGAAALFIGMGLGRFSYTPMIPILIDTGGLSEAEAGYIGAFNLAGFLFGVLFQPKLKLKLGELRSLRTSLAVALSCLIASALPVDNPWLFPWLACWRGLIGVAVGTIMVQALAVVTRAAPPDKLGLATGIVFTGVGGGIFLSGMAIPSLLTYGLPATWAGVAGLGLLAVLIGFWSYSCGSLEVPKSELTRDDSTRLSWTMVGLIAAQSLFVIGLIPHTIFWVDYLVRGLSQSLSIGGFHWTLFGLGALIGTSLWGRLADLIGFQLALILVFTTLAIGLVLPVLFPLTITILASSIIVGAQPGCSALLSGRAQQIFGPKLMPVVWRRMTLIGSIGQAMGGYFLVGLFDLTGSYSLVFLIGAAAMASGAIISAFIK